MHTIDAAGGVLGGSQDADLSDKNELAKIVGNILHIKIDEDLLFDLFKEWMFVTRDDTLEEGEAWIRKRILTVFHLQDISDPETDEYRITMIMGAFSLFHEKGIHTIASLETSCLEVKMRLHQLFGNNN